MQQHLYNLLELAVWRTKSRTWQRWIYGTNNKRFKGEPRHVSLRDM